MDKILKSTVQKILENAAAFDWSLQGLGMLRLYLDKEKRLHVWDDRYVVADVSTIHDHPWDFTSVIVAGTVRNRRYVQGAEGVTCLTQQIVCGPGGCAMNDIKQVKLWGQMPEMYVAGDKYEQRAHEIHESVAESGTVTIIARRVVGDPDRANVFWPIGQAWVSAEPRKATEAEVADITQNALKTWF